MLDRHPAPPQPKAPFEPKFFTVLREGYRARDFRADLIAGLTVAIVALPLSMGIAIASGVTPERGLIASIVGGFLVSMLGGSRFQIGGPAGAFIVLVAGTVAAKGVDGLLIATFLSGLILLGVGLLRLGTYIRYIPYPVTVGFTAGIAVIIAASQLKEFLGLTLAGGEPGPFLDKIEALFAARGTLNLAAAGVALGAVAVILAVRRFRPSWPAFLIGVVVCSLAAWALKLPVATIGTKFGGIPQVFPEFGLPSFDMARIADLMPTALSFALLGGIESLLSAVVADGMTGRTHRSNVELVAQGLANMGSALFGGLVVTGTIARTATNVRSGARSPVAGMLHAVFLAIFMAVAAPLAAFIPLAALAGMLMVVAWNMAERHQFATLLRSSRGDAVVLLATFLLVVFRDLSEGILVGFMLGLLLFMDRMARAVAVETPAGDADTAYGERPLSAEMQQDKEVIVYRISGPFFFGAAAGVGAALDRIGARPKAFVIDLTGVPVIDSTAAATVHGFQRKAAGKGAALYIAGAIPSVRRMLLTHGVRPPEAKFRADVEDALAAIREPGEGAVSAPR